MTEQIFDQSIGLILDIRLWSGAKNLKAEDLQGSQLPPEELVSLGSKRIHDKRALKPIQAVRTKTVNYLESIAVSLYSGKVWLLPENCIDEVEIALSGFANEFDTAVNHFLENFHAQQQQWLEQNKQWTSILEPYLETPDSVKKKIRFQWRTFRMGSANDNALAETVTEDVTHSLLKEVSCLAAEAYETLKDRDRATPKNLQRIDRLASKLRGLSFVDPGVGVIERELSTILESRDADGVLVGSDVFYMARLLVQLKSPTVLEELLDAARKGYQYQFTYDAVQSQAETPAPRPKPKPDKQSHLPDVWF
ncbi:MAG: DUF3150 domain-containing protein [Desulfobacteraceae bacterium]|nr:DUF3150 domain-containing protein [Desulfobacteraceae bacterium]